MLSQQMKLELMEACVKFIKNEIKLGFDINDWYGDQSGSFIEVRELQPKDNAAYKEFERLEAIGSDNWDFIDELEDYIFECLDTLTKQIEEIEGERE